MTREAWEGGMGGGYEQGIGLLAEKSGEGTYYLSFSKIQASVGVGSHQK